MLTLRHLMFYYLLKRKSSNKYLSKINALTGILSLFLFLGIILIIRLPIWLICFWLIALIAYQNVSLIICLEIKNILYFSKLVDYDNNFIKILRLKEDEDYCISLLFLPDFKISTNSG